MPSCYERGIFAELFYWPGFLRITRKREWLRAPLTFVTMDVKNKPEKNQAKFDNLAKPETVTGPRITGCTNNSPSGFNARKVVSSSCWGLGPMHVVDFGKKISTVSNRINLLSFEWDVSPSFSSCRLSHAFRWDTYTVQSLVKYISENNTTRPSEWYLGPRDRPKGGKRLKRPLAFQVCVHLILLCDNMNLTWGATSCKSGANDNSNSGSIYTDKKFKWMPVETMGYYSHIQYNII